MPWPIPVTLLAIVLAVVGCGSASARSAKPESVDLRKEGQRTIPDEGWIFNAAPGSGVPADVFARAMTSLASHYRDDFEALNAHIEEEHAVFLEQAPEASRAYLCCTEYSKGLAVKSALESACGSKASVRTALNNRAFDAYCAIARLSPTEAAEAHTIVHEDARCSPVTHATKEPMSLLELAATVSGNSPEARGGRGSGEAFGLRIAPSLRDGLGRGLVVSLSPGSLPVENVARRDRVKEDTSPSKTGTRGGAAANRQLVEADAHRPSSSALTELEEKWRAFWSNARRVGDPGGLADVIPWTSSSRFVRGRGGDGGRRLVASEDGGVFGRTMSRAQEFHSGKVRGYRAALEHLDEKMGAEGTALSEACGWDSNLSLVHRRNDVVFIRGIHRDDHDEATAAACFVGLVGFLSAQPDVVHIHPEARAEASNKVLTAYMEGGDTTATPMRDAGLDGTGQVIGLTDTGLDESSCFFRDDDYGLVPRTTAEDADFYPDRRKVIQYVDHADGWDANGHGTHVAGIAAGKITSDWETKLTEEVSPEICEEKNMTLSCFGVCVEGMMGSSCHWNPELACPISDCDEDISCDEDTDYIFPCFGDPDEEIPAASGMAPGAKLAFFDIGASDDTLDIPDDLAGMWGAQYAAGARILSNSWSLVTMTEPTSRDVELDEWIHDNPDAFVVFGAGNNGFEDGGFNPSSVQSPATAKTAMTVGASNSGPERAYAYYTTVSSNYDGVMWPYDDVSFEVSPYSARGPVGAFTAKPDVVAPGLMVHSAKASLSEEEQETCELVALGGTSMSAPAVAGAAALVRQYFSEGFLAAFLDGEGLCDEDGAYDRAGLCEAFEPSGYLVKAVLVNSAAWLGDMQTVSYNGTTQWMEVLDFAQGFGAVQLSSTLPSESSSGEAFFHENSLATDDIYYYLIYVNDPSEELSMTTAWYDPPSTVSSYNLLHDLDTYIMSVDTGTYFRSNSYSTIKAMCGEDEDCAQKYDFTFSNKLADYMNPVERIVVSSDELDTGYYVLAVRARTLTESDTQAYGLAVCGGDLELSDLSDSWSNLGLETLSTTEPNPDEEEFAPTAFPTKLKDMTASPTVSPSSHHTASPTVVDPFENAEPATSGSDESGDDYWNGTSGGDDDDETVSSGVTTGSSSSKAATTSSVEIGDDDTPGALGKGTETGVSGNSDGNGGGGQKGAVVAIAVSAAVVVAIGVCFACWRRRGLRNFGSGNGLGKEVNGASLVTRSASPAKVAQVPQGGEDDSEDQMLRTEGYGAGGNGEGGEGELQGGGGSRMPVIQAYLPSYATAVASSPEEEDKVVEVGTGADSEVSAFYAAVDPNAVSNLVGWGISRDFARVALRRKDNDVTEALKLIAEGNMDKLLVLDLEEMARVDAAASADTVVAPGDSNGAGSIPPGAAAF